jgi:putative hydrolase of the HAD superfamily
MNGIRAVFFDAGHTLLRAHPSVSEIYSRITAGLGVRVPARRFQETFMPVFHDFVKRFTAVPENIRSSDDLDRRFWRDMLAELHRTLPEVHDLGFDAWFEALYGAFGKPEAWRLYDDARPALMELRRRGYRLGVISNWDTRLRQVAEGTGLTDLVDFVLISAAVGVRKPDRRIFEAALSRAGVDAASSLHVGDLPEEDVEGALRAGLKAAFINREGRLKSPALPEGVLVLDTLQDLTSLLRRNVSA